MSLGKCVRQRWLQMLCEFLAMHETTKTLSWPIRVIANNAPFAIICICLEGSSKRKHIPVFSFLPLTTTKFFNPKTLVS